MRNNKRMSVSADKNKALYESIMRKVSRVVKQALNENTYSSIMKDIELANKVLDDDDYEALICDDDAQWIEVIADKCKEYGLTLNGILQTPTAIKFMTERGVDIDTVYEELKEYFL